MNAKYHFPSATILFSCLKKELHPLIKVKHPLADHEASFTTDDGS